MVTTRNHYTLSTALELVEASFWLDTFYFPHFQFACIYFPNCWIPTQIQSKTFDEFTVEIGKGRISTLEFKQQHHLWIANCALMGELVQTLCDQAFTAKQVELYYLERIFWNLKNAKKEVFIHQITLADPRLKHLDITYSSTAADFEQWKKHQLATLYILRTLIGFNLLWLLTIVGVKIKAQYSSDNNFYISF